MIILLVSCDRKLPIAEEILATATPLNDELEQYKMKWSFSTGETLTIQMPIEDLEWERHLRFSVKGNRLGVVSA